MEVETPVRAMRTKCLECANWSPSEVAACELTDCALWPYRRGKRPTAEDIAIVKATIDPFAKQKEKLRGNRTGKPENFRNHPELAPSDGDSNAEDGEHLG